MYVYKRHQIPLNPIYWMKYIHREIPSWPDWISCNICKNLSEIRFCRKATTIYDMYVYIYIYTHYNNYNQYYLICIYIYVDINSIPRVRYMHVCIYIYMLVLQYWSYWYIEHIWKTEETMLIRKLWYSQNNTTINTSTEYWRWSIGILQHT